tara:strand:- start:1230 stop:1466 length:237 start_codon:yes stop_codon:yes gene_type:complete
LIYSFLEGNKKLKVVQELKETLNPTVYNRLQRRVNLSCSYCKPHKGENACRKPKYGNKKPKIKQKNRRRIIDEFRFDM